MVVLAQDPVHLQFGLADSVHDCLHQVRLLDEHVAQRLVADQADQVLEDATGESDGDLHALRQNRRTGLDIFKSGLRNGRPRILLEVLPGRDGPVVLVLPMPRVAFECGRGILTAQGGDLREAHRVVRVHIVIAVADEEVTAVPAVGVRLTGCRAAHAGDDDLEVLEELEKRNAIRLAVTAEEGQDAVEVGLEK